jgi:hypothetical protein
MEPTTAIPLPLALSIPVFCVNLLIVLIQAWRLRDARATFILFSIWLRYVIAALWEFTYPPVLFGFSLVAISSIIVVVIGLAVVGGRRLLMRKLLPIYAVVLAILISAAVNHTWMGAVNETLKWLYLIVMALAAYVAMRSCGPNRLLGALMTAFVTPITLQWLSVALDVRLINVEDGTQHFIGGYNHQQGFSIIILTFLFVACFMRLSAKSIYLCLAIAAAGLALANYRTSLLAAALPAASLAVAALAGKVVQKQRAVALLLFGAVTLFVFVGISQLAENRFSDLGTAVEKGASLIQPPQYFTTEERAIFSSRVYLWSLYIDAYQRGTIVNHLVGFGPDAWVGRFSLYAHNTFISNLYELGIFGTAIFIWMLTVYLLAAARVPGDRRLVLIACHIGFIVLNLSTMGFWTIEGDILYALVLAQTWYLQSLKARDRAGSGGNLEPMLSARQYQRLAELGRSSAAQSLKL